MSNPEILLQDIRNAGIRGNHFYWTYEVYKRVFDAYCKRRREDGVIRRSLLVEEYYNSLPIDTYRKAIVEEFLK